MKKIKILTVTLLIILITMVSFFGVYEHVQNRMENKVKEYDLDMDLKGARYIKLSVNKENKDVIKDSEGNKVETEEKMTDEQLQEKGYTKENEPVNAEESLTKENYEKAKKVISERLKAQGIQEYEISLNNGEYDVIVPTWRSTGDVTIKDDVMGDIARILSFDSFEAKPITITFEHSVKQNDVLLERRIKEYLAYRCGFYEIFTYPWIEEKYIKAAGIDMEKSIKLATPPAPDLAYLRSSLIPAMLEAVAKNLRYYDEFRLFDCEEVYEKGDYRPSSEDEILPIQKNYLTGCIVGKEAKEIFYEAKGVIENMAEYCHMEELKLEKMEKPYWADVNAYLNVVKGNEVIGTLGLVSVKVMADTKIKRTNVAMFEINTEKFVPYASRTNEYERLPELPLVEKDLSIIVDEEITWKQIEENIRAKVKEVEFVDEYRGDQIPEGKKSVTLKVKILNEGTTMTSEQINEKMNSILKTLDKRCGAKLRD